MRQLVPAYLIIMIFLFCTCNRYNRQKIRLTGFDAVTEVVYETDDAKFIFSQNDIMNYCKNKDSNDHNNFIYKQVVNYLDNNPSNSILIPDTLGTELVSDSTIPFNNKSGGLSRVRNSKSE